MKKWHSTIGRVRSGFTLLEVLFTVLIVAILAAVAVPLYSSTKTTSETTTCKNNIQAIATAESKYKFDNNAYSTANAATDLLNEGLAAWPACPTTGGTYSIAGAAAGPVTISCSIAAHAANSMTMP
jgi:prepilin-type N-terminal cleavage/methylation domain-containing protein